MVIVIILTVIWALCEAWFIWSRVKNPLKWQENIFKKNKLYHRVQNSIGISGIILFFAWIATIQIREDKQIEALDQAETRKWEDHYRNLDQEIRAKLDTISFYQSQVDSFYDISPHFQLQLSEQKGVSHQSKMIVCGINDDGIIAGLLPFNNFIQETGNYSECKDSIDYIVCLKHRYNKKYYGLGNHHYSSAEHLFVQIFDYKTLKIIDTIHIEMQNPESISVQRGKTYRGIVDVPPYLLQSRLFVKDSVDSLNVLSNNSEK